MGLSSLFWKRRECIRIYVFLTFVVHNLKQIYKEITMEATGTSYSFDYSRPGPDLISLTETPSAPPITEEYRSKQAPQSLQSAGNFSADSPNFAERFTDIKPKWYESSPVRRTITKVLLLAAAIFGAAAVFTGLYLTAAPAVVIGVTLSLAALALVTTISGVVFHLLPKSRNCPEHRRAQAESAWKDITGNHLSYKGIQERYGNEIRNDQILTNEDVNLLLKNDAATLEYPAFINRHGEEVLDLLDSENKAALGEKLLEHISSLGLSTSEAERDWSEKCEKLGVDLANISLAAIQRSYRKLEDGSIDYAAFREECGEGFLEYLSEEQKGFVCIRFLSYLALMEFGMREIPERFAYEWRGFELRIEDVAPCVLNKQLGLLENGKLGFQDFYQKNGLEFESFTIRPRIPKIAFLRMGYADMIREDYKEAREVLGVACKEIFEVVKKDAVHMDYQSFLEKHSIWGIDASLEGEGSVREVLSQRVEEHLRMPMNFSSMLLLFPAEFFKAGLIPKEEVKEWVISFLSGHAEELLEGAEFQGSTLYPYVINQETNATVKQYLNAFEDERNKHRQAIQLLESQEKNEVQFLDDQRKIEEESLKSYLQKYQDRSDSAKARCLRLREKTNEAERQLSDVHRRLHSSNETFFSCNRSIKEIDQKIHLLRKVDPDTQSKMAEYRSKIAENQEELNRLPQQAKGIAGSLHLQSLKKNILDRIGSLQIELRKIDPVFQTQTLKNEKRIIESQIQTLQQRIRELPGVIQARDKAFQSLKSGLDEAERGAQVALENFKEAETSTKEKMFILRQNYSSDLGRVKSGYNIEKTEEKNRFDKRKWTLIKEFKSALSALN